MQQPYVLHSEEGHVSMRPSVATESGVVYTDLKLYDPNFESIITHPWRKYCTSRWEFLPRFIPVALLAFCIWIATMALDAYLIVQPGEIYQRTQVKGYYSLEQANSVSRVEYILRAWNLEQRLTAAFSAGFHFLLFPLYSISLTLLCLWAANHSPLKFVGDLFAWLQILSAIFAMILHSAVASQIVHGPRNGLPQLCVAMTVLHLLLSLSALLYFIIVRIGHWTIWKEYSRRGPLDPETKMN